MPQWISAGCSGGIAVFQSFPNKLGSPAWRLASSLVMMKINIFSRLMSLAADIFVVLDGEPGDNWVKDTGAVVFCWLEDRSVEFSDEPEELGWSKTMPGRSWG